MFWKTARSVVCDERTHWRGQIRCDLTGTLARKLRVQHQRSDAITALSFRTIEITLFSLGACPVPGGPWLFEPAIKLKRDRGKSTQWGLAPFGPLLGQKQQTLKCQSCSGDEYQQTPTLTRLWTHLKGCKNLICLCTCCTLDWIGLDV